MTDKATLEGACSCGRNEYIIIAPTSLSETISVIFDERAEHGETHAEIRRVFTPPHARHTKRHFCGFCGDPLTLWSEQHRSDADWVHVNLGSLRSGSIEKLADEGLLPGSDTSFEAITAQRSGNVMEKTSLAETREIQGAPWFEDIIEGSELGRMKRQRGGHSSADGRSKVSWEVVEFTSDPSDGGSNNGKRKLSQIGKENDIPMRG
ncbi:MAG: hypothetical protein Q9172_007627 [Xanthocarpia lactea]